MQLLVYKTICIYWRIFINWRIIYTSNWQNKKNIIFIFKFKKFLEEYKPNELFKNIKQILEVLKKFGEKFWKLLEIL